MHLGFLLAFFVLFFLVPPLLGQQYSSSTCPKDFACQNLGRLEFPFTNFTQSHCGLCHLNCTFSPPKINLKLNPWSEWSEVLSMPKSDVIKLHDLTFSALLQGRSCGIFTYDLQLLNINSVSISFTTRNVTLFTCSKIPLPKQEIDYHFRGYKKHELCRDFDIYYKLPKHSGSQIPPYPLPSGCSDFQLPMRPMDKVSNDSNLFNLLTADFDLQWHVSNKCYECHNGGGQCESFGENQFFCERSSIGNLKGKKTKLVVITAAPTGGAVLLVILAFCFRKRFRLWKSMTLEEKQLDTFLKNYGSLALKRYHYSDVKKMTNYFENKLGQGGYGSVYKGKLGDGRLVAVKVLKESKGNGEEFINEVASISRTSHVNIVTLLGFCVQGHKRALIYEYMSNGSLEKFIYEGNSLMNRQLEWPILYKIALGIARGLEYLHRGCNTRILHFDIKPQNILLDEDFCPKISDFGLAKLCTRKESIISTMGARGTIGFIAPEVVYNNIGGVSHKSDVYSYGMMVLEMVGGRKNVDVGVDHTSEIYFPHWIYRRIILGEELCLSGIMNEEEDKQARKMLIVSLYCIQTNPSSRPTISNVLEMLEGPLEALQMPQRPFLYSSSRTSSAGSDETGETQYVLDNSQLSTMTAEENFITLYTNVQIVP